MKCHECGGTYIEKAGDLEIDDKYVGPLTIGAVDYLRCNRCREYLFSLKAATQIEEARERALDQMMQSKPISAFISAAAAADLLGMSRQALHKHRRIRRGFIFKTQFGDKTVYLRESVLLFKANSDGRFPLWKPVESTKYTKQVQYTRERETVLDAMPQFSGESFPELRSGVFYIQNTRTAPLRGYSHAQ